MGLFITKLLTYLFRDTLTYLIKVTKQGSRWHEVYVFTERVIRGSFSTVLLSETSFLNFSISCIEWILQILICFLNFCSSFASKVILRFKYSRILHLYILVRVGFIEHPLLTYLPTIKFLCDSVLLKLRSSFHPTVEKLKKDQRNFRVINDEVKMQRVQIQFALYIYLHVTFCIVLLWTSWLNRCH